MSCPCGLTKEEVKDFDQRTGEERVPLVGGKCQNPLANGAEGVCGRGLGAHPLAQEAVGAEEGPRKKARPSGPALDAGPAKCAAILAAEGPHVPSVGATPGLKLPRAALVARVIELVERENREVYIRGAPGAGKSVLLALVGQELVRQNKQIVSVPDARDLEYFWDKIESMAFELGPVYLLVDEVHTATDSSVWKYLKEPFNTRAPVYTIAAGIPDESKASALFQEHTEVHEILLGPQELEDAHVVDFFAASFQQALQLQPPGQSALPAAQALQLQPPGQSTLPAAQALQLQQPGQSALPAAVTQEHRKIALQVLLFAHSYTQGHAYPCLKLAEYFLTEASAQCTNPDLRVALFAVIASENFLESVFKKIYSRCFGRISTDTAVHLLEALGNPQRAMKVYIDLTRLGLWLPRQGMSLLLQYAVMQRYGQAAGEEKDLVVSYDNFGEVLLFALRTLTDAHFSQLSSLTDVTRQRCEDGIGLFIGARLYTIDGLYLSPQHALPIPHQAGRPPSVDYYINGSLDMFLELTRNGSLLEKHFKRFQAGGAYYGKKFVLLDLELTKAESPAPLPEPVRMYEELRYTYVVKINTLYRGTEVFRTGVRPIVTHS